MPRAALRVKPRRFGSHSLVKGTVQPWVCAPSPQVVQHLSHNIGVQATSGTILTCSHRPPPAHLQPAMFYTEAETSS